MSVSPKDKCFWVLRMEAGHPACDGHESAGGIRWGSEWEEAMRRQEGQDSRFTPDLSCHAAVVVFATVLQIFQL